MTEDQFHASLRQDGYLETKFNEYGPGHRSELHTHDFSARLLVLEGEFVLRTPDGNQVFAPGELCDVPAGTVHAEQTEAVGARVLAGLKHPA